VTIFTKACYRFRITLNIIANKTAILLIKSRVLRPYPLTKLILLTDYSLTLYTSRDRNLKVSSYSIY